MNLLLYFVVYVQMMLMTNPFREKIRYRDEISSGCYDRLNMPLLPFLSNVLPSSIVSHLSRKDLHKNVYLYHFKYIN